MGRVPYVEPGAASAEVEPVFARVSARAGRVLNFFRALANFPAVLAPTEALLAALRGSTLAPRLRELAYLKASQLNDCGY